jgi:hypothetical protein
MNAAVFFAGFCDKIRVCDKITFAQSFSLILRALKFSSGSAFRKAGLVKLFWFIHVKKVLYCGHIKLQRIVLLAGAEVLELKTVR